MKTQFCIAAFAAGIALSVASPAFAQAPADGECQADSDCPPDFVCEVFEWGACPSCAPGEECPPCETGSDSVCVPPPPKECDADNACDDGNVCVTYTFESCASGGSSGAAPACDPDDTDCGGTGNGNPGPPTCESSTESYCVPPYLAPCQADADCGGGFTCEAIESCACSGGGSTDVPPGEPDMGSSDPVEPDCSCEVGDEHYCRLIEVECTADDDCDGELTCQDLYGGEAPSIGCVVPDGSDETCPEPEPVDPTSYCAPEGYGYFGGDLAGGGYGDSVAEATGRGNSTVTQSEREEFFPVDGTNGDGSSKESPSGCSTANGGSGGSMLLLLAGLLLGGRRRRS